MNCTLRRDPADVTRYLVICDESPAKIAIFAGPDALNRAADYAGGDEFSSWSDPEGLVPDEA